MEDWLGGGRAAELVLALMAFEAVALVWFRRRTGRGIPALELLTSLAAGAMLVLALRAVLLGQGLAGATPFLLAALAAHVTDLAVRWKR
jgi:hypothetical protein